MASVAERYFPVNLPPGIPAPNVEDALRKYVGNAIKSAWMTLALPHSASGEMMSGFTDSLAYPYGGDPDAVAVVNTTAQAYWLEFGRPGFHLPSHWGRGGGKWKTGKSGRRYAHVKFVHRSPFQAGGGVTSGRQRSAMPSDVYAMASALEHEGGILSGMGDAYKQSKSYTYYRQIFPDFPSALPGSYTWKSSPYEGMVRSVEGTPGGGHQTGERDDYYQTVRTITEDSPGWFIPPTPAYHYAEQALEDAAPAIQEIIDQAAAVDLAAAVIAATVGLIE